MPPKKPAPHVTIDTDSQPRTSFVEKIHTPHHSNPHADMSIEDWDQEKHAHIDEGVISPHGTVKRRLTPLKPDEAQGSAFPAAGDDLVSPAALKPVAPPADNSKTFAFAVSVAVAAVLIFARLSSA